MRAPVRDQEQARTADLRIVPEALRSSRRRRIGKGTHFEVRWDPVRAEAMNGVEFHELRRDASAMFLLSRFAAFGRAPSQAAVALRKLPTLTAFRLLLTSCLVVASFGALFATWRSLETAKWLGARSLESTALALAAAAENALRAGEEGELRSILSDRVVAYALIADRDGTIRFHANPELIGSKLPRLSPDAPIRSHRPVANRITLGLGTPAYAYDYPLDSGETLRLVLHLGPVDRLGKESRQLWTIIGGVLGLLTLAGLGLDRLLVRLLALRDEMSRRERLSLVGQMTATLAHEIRNALWGVQGYAQWLNEKLQVESPGKHDVAAILEGTGRIQSLVDDLLLYAKEENYRVESVRLAHVVECVRSETLSNWPGTLEVDVGSELSVLADAEKLHRVLVNGLRNAVQAMGQEGTLTIRAVPVGRFASLEVGDTGGGLRAEALGKAFSPFFTTKTDGTGLGLAYSRKVMEGMGGAIDLRNRGDGAVLRLKLPLFGSNG